MLNRFGMCQEIDKIKVWSISDLHFASSKMIIFGDYDSCQALKKPQFIRFQWQKKVSLNLNWFRNLFRTRFVFPDITIETQGIHIHIWGALASRVSVIFPWFVTPGLDKAQLEIISGSFLS